MLPQAQCKANESWTHSVTIIIWCVGAPRTNALSWIDCVAHAALQFYCLSSRRSLRSLAHYIICSLWPPPLIESSQQGTKQMFQSLALYRPIHWQLLHHKNMKKIWRGKFLLNSKDIRINKWKKVFPIFHFDNTWDIKKRDVFTFCISLASASLSLGKSHCVETYSLSLIACFPYLQLFFICDVCVKYYSLQDAADIIATEADLYVDIRLLCVLWLMSSQCTVTLNEWTAEFCCSIFIDHCSHSWLLWAFLKRLSYSTH